MITAKMVQELREKTGAGMMDCKKALTAANGDIEAAVENLRKSGIAKAEKKAGRSTNQGKVWTGITGNSAVIIELLCETDFAAKTPKFCALVEQTVADALSVEAEGDVCEAANAVAAANLTSHIATIGENMQLRRAMKWNGTGSKFGGYHHMGGRVSVLVEVEGDASAEVLNDLCLHIAAFSPAYITSDDVPAEIVAKEKEIAAASDPKLAGKPAEMLEKILAGKINRYFSEVCLVNQPWVKDDKSTFAKLYPALKIKRFVRWAVGEEQ